MIIKKQTKQQQQQQQYRKPKSRSKIFKLIYNDNKNNNGIHFT